MVNMMPRETHSLEFKSIAQKQLAVAGDDLFLNVFGNDKMISSATPAKNEYMTTGQVDSMTIPEGWVKRDSVNLKANSGLVEYHPAGDNDVRLNSYYRGYRISAEGANVFKECLASAAHAISKGSNELNSLAEVINDKTGNFNVSSASTEVLNGKKVLVVEGSYKDAEHTTSRTVYVDSDGTGSAVQEISYIATGSLYKAHAGAADKAFKSIIWK